MHYKRLVFLLRMSAIGDVIIAARNVVLLRQNGYFPVFVTTLSMRDVPLHTVGLDAVVCIENDLSLHFWYEKKKVTENVFAEQLRSLKIDLTPVVLDLQKTSRSQKAFKALRASSFGSGLRQREYVSKRTWARFSLVLKSFFSFRQKKQPAFIMSSVTTIHKLQENLLRRLFAQDQKTDPNFTLTKPFLERSGESASFLQERGLKPGTKYVCVFPGSSGFIKSWPKENFRALIGLILNTTSFSILILGSKQEEYLGEYLNYPKHERLINLVNTTSLSATLDLIAGAQHVFTNDSFAAHAADAYRIPATVIFGSTTPQFGFVPLFEKINVEYAHLSCSPCTRHGKSGCRFQNLRCFTEISAEKVLSNLSLS